MKVGVKTKDWIKKRAELKKIYEEVGITSCELKYPGCLYNWALSFHHLDKRSSGKAEHTFSATRLLCQNCHQLAEYNKEVNQKLREIR